MPSLTQSASPGFETFRGLGIFSRYTGIDLVDQWDRNRTRLPSAAHYHDRRSSDELHQSYTARYPSGF